MAKAALLIDADNLSSASDVEEAFRQLAAMGLTVTVRRAYGGLDKLSGIKEVLRSLAVRSFINQGKGTTDVALVVDAMDLLYNDSLAPTVAIASSDADFAPLALRLREAGMRVVCFARREKSDAEALALAYDEVLYVDLAPQRAAPHRAPAAAKAAPVARRSPARKAASAAAPANPAVEAILQAVPTLRTGQLVPMNDVVKKLRDDELLSKHGKLATLLGKSGGDFRLLPPSAPKHVQWMGRSAP